MKFNEKSTWYIHFSIFRTLNPPILAHCSAGVGRSGTLVAIDGLIQQLREEKQVQIFNMVVELRRQRNFLVQSVVSIYSMIRSQNQHFCYFCYFLLTGSTNQFRNWSFKFSRNFWPITTSFYNFYKFLITYYFLTKFVKKNRGHSIGIGC